MINKAAQSASGLSPTNEEIAKWMDYAPIPNPDETAREDMRAIAEKYASELAKAFLKMSESA